VAERFGFGFAVSVDALWNLVGSGLDADELLASVDGEFVDMFADEFEPPVTLTGCARDVLTGRLDDGLDYPYARLVEPLLTVVAEPLGMIHIAHTYYLSNDTFGRWNPVLKALGLRRLAALWAAPNCAFPWPRGRSATVDWPCVTEYAPAALVEIGAELATDWRSGLDGLADSALADADLAEPARREWAADVRVELGDSLDQLRDWVDRAARPWTSHRRCVEPSGNSLVVVTDGSQ
jgi:hypothetical protein